MTASILYPSLLLAACTLVTACASDKPPDRQRPAYSFENVDMGSNQSVQQRRIDEPPPPSNDPYNQRGYGR